MESNDCSYMGPNWERRLLLADVTVVAQGRRLPAHRAILAASEVLLELFHDLGAQGQPTDLEAPFAGAGEAGARLFLACLYQPQRADSLVAESLAADPEGTAARDLLSLAHFLNAQELLEGCQRCLCSLVGALEAASLLDWVAVAERCEAEQLLPLLMERAVAQLANSRLCAEAVERVLESAPSAAKRAEIVAAAAAAAAADISEDLGQQLAAEVAQRERFKAVSRDLKAQLQVAQDLLVTTLTSAVKAAAGEGQHDGAACRENLAGLVRLLSSGNVEAQAAAGCALWDLASDSALKTTIAAVGAIPVLVLLLATDSEEMQEVAAGALQLLAAGSPGNRSAIAAAGAIPALVRLLGSDSDGVQEVAALVLRRLAFDSTLQGTIAAAGAIPVLVLLLVSGREVLQGEAAGTLSSLARDDSLQRTIAAAGAIPPLVRLLGGSTVRVQQEAAGALCNLTAGSASNNSAVAAAGAIPVLVRLLGSAAGKLQEGAAGVLQSLAVDSPRNKSAIAAAGAIPALVRLLGSHSERMQGPAAKTLRSLASDNSLRDTVAMAGAIPELVRLLGSGSVAIQEAATGALCNLAAGSAGIKLAIRATGAIPTLVELLGSSSEGVQEAAAGALCNLSHNSSLGAEIRSHGGGAALKRRRMDGV